MSRGRGRNSYTATTISVRLLDHELAALDSLRHTDWRTEARSKTLRRLIREAAARKTAAAADRKTAQDLDGKTAIAPAGPASYTAAAGLDNANFVAGRKK